MVRSAEVRAGAASIHDVARAAGVSTGTVSRALRGLDRVSPVTRGKVLEAATRLHYVASPSAASLASGRTCVVGVVVPFLNRWFFANVLDAVEQALRKDGYHLLLFNIGTRASQRTLMLDRALLAKRIDALLVLASDLEPAEVEMLDALHVPVVAVGVDLPGADLVGIDDVAAGREATDHLLALGHRRIAYVGGSPGEDVHVATAQDRLAGLLGALATAGVTGEPELLESDWTIRGGMAAGDRLLSRPDPPSAVFAASDEMAIGVLLAARSLGVDVPGRVSVVGVDDHEMSFAYDLTTVAQPLGEVGRTAAARLVEAMAEPRHDRTVSTLPTALVVRGSTAPPG